MSTKQKNRTLNMYTFYLLTARLVPFKEKNYGEEKQLEKIYIL